MQRNELNRPGGPAAVSSREAVTVCAPETCRSCTARPFSVCAPVVDSDLPEFFGLAQHLHVEPRQTLCHEGDPARYVFSISRGAVSLSKTLPDGRRQITGFLQAGDFIGLSHGEVCSHTAEALTTVKVCRFPRERFERYLAEHPPVEHRLLHMASTELAAAQEQMLLLGRKTAIERVASFLLRQSARAHAIDQAANPVELPMSRSEIADYLGLTIETVSRTITRLRRCGAIELRGTYTVFIKSEEALRRLAEGG